MIKKRKSSDPFDSDDDGQTNISIDSDDSERGFFKCLCDIAVNSIEKSNDKFDLPLGFLFGLVFFYLTLGAVFSSRISSWSLFNGYYFSLISLTKIGLGDLVIDDTTFILFSTIYILFGLAFFDLTILVLQEKIRLLLIQNGKNIINEICKFVNQFGYNWSIERISSNLDNLGKSSLHFSLGTINAKRVNEPEQEEESFSQAIKNYKNTINSRKGKKIKSSFDRVDHSDHLQKCDKQTQITTLLCSRFKSDNYSKGFQSLSSSYTNLTVDLIASPIQVAPIKPNAVLEKLIEENSRKEDEINIESSLNDENSSSTTRLRKTNRFFDSDIPSANSSASSSSFTSKRSSRFK